MSKIISRKLLLSTTVISLGALAGSQAFAQIASTPTPARTSAETGLEEVIVTAQKRVENVQDIPKQVQVVSQAVLKENNVTTITDLRKLVPSIAGAGNAIRGVATSASSISANSKVGIVLDDVPIPSRAGSASNLLDIERAEVLAGPQGTLAGRNATGGLINLVTRAPSLTGYHGSFQAQGTSDFEYIAGAFITGPITDTVAFSLSSNYQRFRGLAYNRFNGVWASNENENVRAKLLFQPSDDLRITATAAWLLDMSRAAGTVYAGILVPQTSITNGLDQQVPKRTFADFFPGTVPSDSNQSYYSPRSAKNRRISKSAILRIEKDLNENNMVTFVASALNEKAPTLQDITQTTLVNMNIRPEYGTDGGFAVVGNGTSYKTAELRLSSVGDTKLTYIGGIFVSDNVNTYDYRRYYLPVNWNRSFGQSNGAAYGSVSYKFDTGTTVRGGLRYERDHIDYNWIFNPILATTRTLENGVVLNFPKINDLVVSKGSYDDSFINYDFGIQQQVSEDVMVYATYAKANQGPVYDAEDNVVAIAGTLQPLPSEKVKSYEFGVKSQWFNRRLTANANYFHSLFDNYQSSTTTVDGTNPNAVPVLKLNAVGSVLTKGVEFNINALVLPGLRVSVNGTRNIAVINDFPYAPCYTNQSAAGGCITAIVPGERTARPYQANLAGGALASAPKYRGNMNVAYTHTLGFLPDTDWNAAFNVRYQSKQITNILQDPLSLRAATTFVNANFGFSHGPYKIDFAANNLFKEAKEVYGAALPQGFASPPRGADGSSQILSRSISRDNTRYYSVRLSATF
jgi:iron complex outermembrane receptor protein